MYELLMLITLYHRIHMSISCGLANPLFSLSRNTLQIFRHPNHIQTNVFLWTHHEKIVVIDQTLAFVGGIDLAFGRYDNHCHPLTDIGRPPPNVESVIELAKAVTLVSKLNIQLQQNYICQPYNYIAMSSKQSCTNKVSFSPKSVGV